MLANSDEKAYMEGFRDGRTSMAASVARRLFGLKSDREIAFITGLNAEDLAKIREEEESRKNTVEEEQASYSLEGLKFLRDVALSGTALVEPTFVRMVRDTLKLTQASFARKLGVHENTVCSWETSDLPVRIRKATYEQLLYLLGTHNEE